MAETNTEDELEWLDKVFLRIVSAKDDDDLTRAMEKYLPTILKKLASTKEGVRKMVMEMLVHINKRIKTNANVQLPVESLTAIYSDPKSVSFITNFTIIYIRMGLARLPPTNAAKLVPLILQSLSGKPELQQDSLLVLLIPILSEVKAPSEDPQAKLAYLGLANKHEVGHLFKEYLMDYLLLPYGSHPSLIKDTPIAEKVPAGMSENSWKRVAGEKEAKAEEIEKNKADIVKFLGKGFFPEMEIALHLIIASTDTRLSVTSEAESVLRKLMGVIDWNDDAFIKRLYTFFLGFSGDPVLRSKDQRVPANARIRIKLVPILMKGTNPSSHFPHGIQVINELLFSKVESSRDKLRGVGLIYVHFLIDNCPEPWAKEVAPKLLFALKDVLENPFPPPEARPRDGSDAPTYVRTISPEVERKVRVGCYTAIGKLARLLPSLVNQDISIMQMFFQAMETENKETQLSIKESVSMMANQFKTMDPANLTFVEALLATHIESDSPQLRLVSAQYAGDIFPPSHIGSRYLLLIAAGDANEDVRRLAVSKLYGPQTKAKQRSRQRIEKSPDERYLPEFTGLLSFILEKAKVRVNTRLKAVICDVNLAFHMKTYEEVLNFLRICMMADAGVLFPEKEDLNTCEQSGPVVRRFLQEFDNHSHDKLLDFVRLAETFLLATPGMAQAQCILHLVACVPSLVPYFSDKLHWIKGFLNNSREILRFDVARLYSIIASTLDMKEFVKSIEDLQKGFKDKNLDCQHGIIVTLGFSLAKKNLVEKSEEDTVIFWEILREKLKMFTEFLTHSQPLMVSGACVAIGEIGRCGPLVETRKQSPDETEQEIVDCLLRLVSSQKTPIKIRERAALSIGLVCLGDPSFKDRERILEEFLKASKDIQEVELQLTMSEAFVNATFGPLSHACRDPWSVSEEDFKSKVADDFSDEIIDNFVRKLTDVHTLSHVPNERQTACFWLLAIIKSGPKSKVVRKNLLKIQSSFMSLLSDSREIVQDAASKGIGLVYDISSDDQKSELVNILLQTLGAKTATVKVTETTELFSEENLGKTPTGDNLTTYKEICALASDVNPELVYQFMHLANNNAVWQSRLGGAFGFSGIMEKAGERLEPFLPTIIPKLYRYQFDPVPKIQIAMSSIWSILVPDPSKTIDLHLQTIVNDLQKNLTNNQWRVREACCSALQDLVVHRSLDTVLDTIPNIWRDIFRLMDDVKESCRIAAGKTVTSLTRACVKMCDVAQFPKSGEAAIKAILPALISGGLIGGNQEVRHAAADVVAKLARSAGVLLTPHLHDLIPALLMTVGEAESKENNVVSNRLANDSAIQERIDTSRILMAKASPTMDCVNYCVRLIDGSVLEKLIPLLIDLLKKPGVSIVTKGLTLHLVTSLIHQCPNDLQQYTRKLMAALVHGLSDRNLALRKLFATSIGQMFRTAKSSSIEKLFEKLKNNYLENEEESIRKSVALTFQAIVHHNPDRLREHATITMPLVFMAMHEKPNGSNEDVIEVWEEVWSEGTPGTEGGLRLYLSEIIPLLTSCCESPKWRLKIVAARAMATIGSKGSEWLPKEEGCKLLTNLVNGLPGRTWEGKEEFLIAIMEIVSRNPSNARFFINSYGEEKFIMQMIKECMRERKDYRIVALKSTGVVLKKLELDYFTIIYQEFQSVFSYENESERSDEDEDAGMHIELENAVIECLSCAWPKNKETQKKHLVEILNYLAKKVDQTTRKNQMTIASTIGELIENLSIDPIFDDDFETIFERVGETMSVLLRVPKATQLRSKSVEVTGKVLDVFLKCNKDNYLFLFKRLVAGPIDDVIKDLGGSASVKDDARIIKQKLANIVDPSEESINASQIADG